MNRSARVALGDCLRAKCRTEGWSLRQAGIKTGISHTTMAAIVNGSRSVSAVTVKKLAQAFSASGGHHRGVMEDELLILAGYRPRRPKGQDLSQPQAQLLDAASGLTERQIRLLISLGEFMAELETKRRCQTSKVEQ